MVKIVSLYPKELRADRPWSPHRGAGFHQYVLPAAELGKYVELEVEGAFQKTYYGEDIGYKDNFIPDRDVALDLVNVWTQNLLGASMGAAPGIFIVDPRRPLKEQIAEASERQENFFVQLYQAGEDLAKQGLTLAITKDMKDAAKYLGRDTTSWVKELKTQKLQTCPFCYSEIPAQAVVCRECRRDLPAKKKE